MADHFVDTAFRLFTWRILSNFVSPWELEQIRKNLESWDDWCAEWSRWAQKHIKIGDEALESGHLLTAGNAYIRAALFYHWASFLFNRDLEQMKVAFEAMADCLHKAAPLVDPPMEMIEIPFEGTTLPGYLRKPNGLANPPIIVMVPGGDSTKEELYDLAENILARGLATLVFDGPGHGKVSFHLKLRPDYEVPIRTVIDYVMKRDDLDTSHLALGGISYGGHFACRGAAFDHRVKAVFSISSWYSPAGRWSSMAELSQSAIKQYMGENAPDVQDSMTLAGVAERIKVPLLQIYGGSDPASPPEHAYRTAEEVQGPTTTLVFDEGVHVCNNIHHIIRPIVGDWLAETLR
jgi:dienelactone hydrolase